MNRLKQGAELEAPNGILFQVYRPNGVMNANRGLAFSETGIT